MEDGLQDPYPGSLNDRLTLQFFTSILNNVRQPFATLGQQGRMSSHICSQDFLVETLVINKFSTTIQQDIARLGTNRIGQQVSQFTKVISIHFTLDTVFLGIRLTFGFTVLAHFDMIILH
jgi:hypothetical protein